MNSTTAPPALTAANEGVLRNAGRQEGRASSRETKEKRPAIPAGTCSSDPCSLPNGATIPLGMGDSHLAAIRASMTPAHLEHLSHGSSIRKEIPRPLPVYASSAAQFHTGRIPSSFLSGRLSTVPSQAIAKTQDEANSPAEAQRLLV